MAGIYSSPYPIEKIGDSPYPYPYPVNAGIPRQNGDGFGQYPRGRVYLPSLMATGRCGDGFRYSVPIPVTKIHPHPHTQTQWISNFCSIPIPIG